MPNRTAHVAAARALMDFALSKGCSTAFLVERSGIDLADLRDDENRIPLAKYVALMKAAQEATGDPAFALHFGESDAGLEATLACMMGVFSPTMAGAFAHLNGDGRDPGSNSDRYRMTRDEEGVWIADTWNADFPEGKESSFARAVCAARRLLPGMDFMKAVHFTHAEPPYRAEYDRIFRMPIVFGSDRNALLTDAAWLTQMQKPQEPLQHVLEIANARAEPFLRRAEAANCTRSRVEAVLADLLQTAEVSSEAVARNLGVGRYTLFRKLRAEGVTFRQVLDELRCKLAVDYLREKKLAVNEASYLLGFSDPAAFSRAYKRWTGHRPSRSA